MDAAIRSSVASGPVSSTTEHYRRIVADMEHDPASDIWHKTTELAEQAGVSVRTLQSATRAICGMSPHRYSRVLRLWSVRKQLRTGRAGRSVKSCALAHGFWHLSEFAASYREAFGELPSETSEPVATRRIARCVAVTWFGGLGLLRRSAAGRPTNACLSRVPPSRPALPAPAPARPPRPCRPA